MKRKTWMKPSRPSIAAGFIIAVALNLLAADVKVVANPSVKTDSISAGELKSVFLLQTKTLKDGSSVVPVLEKSGVAHRAFLREYLDRGDAEIWTYYQGMVFTGKASMPKTLNSDDEVVAYVARTRGAIGYVSSTADTEGVKVLIVLSEGRRGERALLTRVEPEYPETLKRLQIGGTVRLELNISPKGPVEEVQIVGGNPILGEAAMKAVKQWVYAPSSTRSKIQITIPFNP